MGDELSRLDATAQAALVRDRELTPAELVEAAISRIDAVDGRLNAVIHRLDERALAAASGELPRGPFAGVPFLLKDLGAALAGEPLQMGMRLLREIDFRAPLDSYLAQRFRAAGLITLGKTNVPELGIQPTTEPRSHGPTRNPWDLTRSPGGSSGGAAAAVAAGLVPIAHASDGGGSIRIPASACGLVGLKPTRQRTTLGPLLGDVMSGMSTEHVVTRSVRDTAAALDAVHGPAPGDPYVAPHPQRPYCSDLDADPGRLRCAVITDPPIEGLDSDEDCHRAVRAAATMLEGLGHDVAGCAPVGAAAGLELEDAFLTRWAAGQAAALSQVGRLIGRAVVAADVEPLTWALAEVGRQRDAGRYLRDVALHQAATRAVAGWFEGGIDVLVTPTMAEAPVPLGTHDDSGPDPLAAFRRAAPQGGFTALFNATGQPAISLPLHWSDSGLPIGVQLVGAYGREDVLIRVAAQLERAHPWAGRTPSTFADGDT